MPYLMPTQDETSITLNFKDGQEPLTIDVVDVDRVIGQVYEKDIPEDSSFERVFAQIFLRLFNRKLTPSGVLILCDIKAKLFEQVKKNLFMQDEQSDTSVQDNSSPNETSTSSN